MKRILLGAAAAGALFAGLPALADSPAPVSSATTPVLSTIKGGPWALAQGPASIATPYQGFCVNGAQTVSPGVEPMQPYYFPHVTRLGNYLQGWFDYRPRNQQEAVVTAVSRDHGLTWQFQQQAAGLTTACPADPTSGDNVNIFAGNGPIVANQVFDNGQGHPFEMTVGSAPLLYTLDRSTDAIDVAGLIVHDLSSTLLPLEGVADVESVGLDGVTGSIANQGLVAPVEPLTRTTGLLNPDAILGVFPGQSVTTVLYVSKILNGDNTPPTALPIAQQCKKTPSFAITAGRAANHDLVTQRIATTTDGIHFVDQGAVSGLGDPTTVSYHGIRYLGSGSLFPLANSDGSYNGRYGLVFGAGNCLDGDSDGFHFVGYAETTTAGDLFHWTVLNGLDNPIISTGQITDTSTTPHTIFPANTPLADATDWPTPAATNFYYGRSYGPAVAWLNQHQVTVVFAGYNTPQPKLNLGNYRSIGVTTITLPATTFVHSF
jgi:hypothetical protein